LSEGEERPHYLRGKVGKFGGNDTETGDTKLEKRLVIVPQVGPSG